MSKPQRVVTSTTHYWCEYCLKFIKNTSIDRKSHENGEPHQKAKAKRITELRSGSADTKLTEEIAKLQKAGAAAMQNQLAQDPAPISEYSTYTPVAHVAPVAPAVQTAPKKTAAPSTTKASSTEAEEAEVKPEEVPESAKEAPLPGAWQVVEEFEDDEEEVQDDEYTGVGSKLNLKKRERYGEEESALDQMEEESREISRHTKGERVPEAYRADSLTAPASTEPVFKAKVAKGGNIKKRVKQL